MNDVMKVGILTGPTATGKSGLALQFAQEQGNIEIINADSMLVYRGMNIGTAKPSPDELKLIPHHLIDIRDPSEAFTAGEFYRAAQAAIDDVHRRGKRALIVGGTGFYLKSLLFGLWSAPSQDPEIRQRLNERSVDELYEDLFKQDPLSAERIGRSDRYRLVRALELIELTGKTPTDLQSAVSPEPDPRFMLWIIDRSNEELFPRIEKRTEEMLQAGFVQEVETLLRLYPESRALSAVGYAQVCDFLKGRAPEGRKIKPGLEGLSEEICLATRQLVKRQRTWFRGQNRGLDSKWFQLDNDLSQLREAFNSVYE